MVSSASPSPAFSELDQRAELCERVNRIEGLEISPEKKYPGIGFSKLREKNELETLFEALEWMVERIRAHGL